MSANINWTYLADTFWFGEILYIIYLECFANDRWKLLVRGYKNYSWVKQNEVNWISNIYGQVCFMNIVRVNLHFTGKIFILPFPILN